jgi:hypothetical protein
MRGTVHTRRLAAAAKDEVAREVARARKTGLIRIARAARLYKVDLPGGRARVVGGVGESGRVSGGWWEGER